MKKKENNRKKYEETKLEIYKKYLKKGVITPLTIESEFYDLLIPFLEEEIERFDKEKQELDLLENEIKNLKYDLLDNKKE